jgi:tetratricopeptide (TPR) repeat protein
LREAGSTSARSPTTSSSTIWQPAHVLYYAAMARIMGHRPKEAATLLTQLVSGDNGDPKMEWFRALISVYLELEDKVHGGATVSAMLDQFGDDPDAWILAFQFSAATGDYSRAAAALTITGYLRPLAREEEMQLGDLYTAIEVPAVACSHYETALENGGDTHEYERLSSAYLAAHDSEHALETIQRALKKEPSVRLYSLLGDLYYIEKNHHGAYDAYQHCAALDETYGRAYLMMGYCALEMGQTDEAISKLERARDFPDYADAAKQLLDYARR